MQDSKQDKEGLDRAEGGGLHAGASAAELDNALNQFAILCHQANKRWWLDLENRCPHCFDDGTILTSEGQQPCKVCGGMAYGPKDRNVGELLMLCVSELAEAMEGHRKNLRDDKLPHRSMFEVEIADCLIRLFDLCGAKGLDIGGAFVDKMAYNAQRADHKIENRKQPGGKAY